MTITIAPFRLKRTGLPARKAPTPLPFVFGKMLLAKGRHLRGTAYRWTRQPKARAGLPPFRKPATIDAVINRDEAIREADRIRWRNDWN